MSTVALPVSVLTWIAVSSTSRSRNGVTTPSAGRDDDQPRDEAEARTVRTEQPDDPAEVRLADGRVRGAHGWFEARRFPPPSGHESSVPAEGRAEASYASDSIVARTRAVSSFAAAIVACAGSTRIGSPTTTRTRALRGTRVPGRSTWSAPTNPHRDDRRARGQGQPRGPAVPGPSVAPENRALREDRDDVTAAQRIATAAAIASRSPRPRRTWIPPSPSRTRPTSRFDQSSSFATNRSGRSNAVPRKNGSASESWFDDDDERPGR